MADLQPLFDEEAGLVWRCFSDICDIPRPSKHEERIRQHLLRLGEEHGWTTRLDDVGNVVLSVPGRGHLAAADPLILQSHMDMVCEKNTGVDHDFLNDPIRPRITDDGWVMASGTTLGADNGIGVALSLAVAMEPMPDRLPLDILVTVDEETGLTGALEFDPNLVQGRQLLNLDSEEDWQFIIGCAGGVDMTAVFPLSAAPAQDGPAFECHIRGLQGGHSGVQIHEPKANAIRAAADLLAAATKTSPGLTLHELTGGNKRNAIPRECSCIVSGCERSTLDALARACQDTLHETDPEARVWVEQVDDYPTVQASLACIEFIRQVPHGVLAMDEHFEGVVKTSNNVSVVTCTADEVRILMHGRSASDRDKEELVQEVNMLTSRLGGQFRHGGTYPGWLPSPGSRLLSSGVALYRELFGEDAEVVAIHAGLEAGILGAALDSQELLSYGPTILNPHSPDEKLEITSVAKVYRWLCAFVSREIGKKS